MQEAIIRYQVLQSGGRLGPMGCEPTTSFVRRPILPPLRPKVSQWSAASWWNEELVWEEQEKGRDCQNKLSNVTEKERSADADVVIDVVVVVVIDVGVVVVVVVTFPHGVSGPTILLLHKFPKFLAGPYKRWHRAKISDCQKNRNTPKRTSELIQHLQSSGITQKVCLSKLLGKTNNI